MIAHQKKLLESVRRCEREALTILNAGQKISGIVQKLRGAGNDLEARVRFLEKHAVAATPPSPVTE